MVQFEKPGYRGREGALEPNGSGFKSYLCHSLLGDLDLEPVTASQPPPEGKGGAW